MVRRCEPARPSRGRTVDPLLARACAVVEGLAARPGVSPETRAILARAAARVLLSYAEALDQAEGLDPKGDRP
jgi:hypothetical protein